MIQILTGIQNTSAALDAERTRLDVISQNIANAQTTHDVNGQPYQRKVVVFETALQNAMGSDGSSLPAIQVAKIVSDKRPPLMVPAPGNPDADKNGNVA